MPAERSVYLLDPKELSPETIAVTFAKTSRSPESFREIAAELTSEKSAEFHEKWVVGYGHASVAEHAVLHIAAENISRLAVEALESNRLASYTEKSTRYQKWGSGEFYIPGELEGHPLRDTYLETCRLLMETYQQALPAVRRVIEGEHPRRDGESEAAWERRIRSKYVDVCRFLLPSASLANVGMTINARELEHAIRKMLSHPLDEVRALGSEIKAVAQANVPTLVKYADAVPYWQQLRDAAPARPDEVTLPDGDWCRLIDYDPQGEIKVLAAWLYTGSSLDYAQCLERVRHAVKEELQELAAKMLAGRGKYDIPPRETELASYTFDLVLDQGAYFELKRHRMMTQLPQPLTARLGYALPRRMVDAGMEAAYRRAMEKVEESYTALAAWNPEVAAYVVPNGFRRRVLLTFNFRTAMHFTGLRSAPNAHFSLRRAAQRMAEEIRRCSPALGAYLPVNPEETWQSIESKHFAAA